MLDMIDNDVFIAEQNKDYEFYSNQEEAQQIANYNDDEWKIK